jgi:hypothetical protein
MQGVVICSLLSWTLRSCDGAVGEEPDPEFNRRGCRTEPVLRCRMQPGIAAGAELPFHDWTPVPACRSEGGSQRHSGHFPASRLGEPLIRQELASRRAFPDTLSGALGSPLQYRVNPPMHRGGCLIEWSAEAS